MEISNPVHPGKMLNEIYLKENSLPVSKAALMLGLSRKHLSNIVNCKVPITAEVALRFEKCFKTTSAYMWLKLQSKYDIWQLRQKLNLDNVVSI